MMDKIAMEKNGLFMNVRISTVYDVLIGSSPSGSKQHLTERWQGWSAASEVSVEFLAVLIVVLNGEANAVMPVGG